MTRILVQNHGRMANQLIAWAKARCILNGRTCDLALNYGPLYFRVALPNTDIFEDADLSHWPLVDTGTLPDDGNAAWDSTTVWNAPVDDADFHSQLDCIRFTSQVTDEVGDLLGNGRWVGMHIRYGDYRIVDWRKPPFPLPVFYRAPSSYYRSAWELCRRELSPIKLFVASDGMPEELRWLPECTRSKVGSNPAVDLCALSKCEVVIGSNSTFGHLASKIGHKPFLSPSQSEQQMKECLKK